MRNEAQKGKFFARRSLVLTGIKLTLMTSLLGRLYYLQAIKTDEYKTMSDSNRIKLFLIPPLRGNIVDRGQRLLAENKNYYRVLMDPEQTVYPMEVFEKLSKIISIPEKKQKRIRKKIQQNRSRQSLMLYDHLTWEEVSKVEVNSPDLPGISIDVGQVRHYPLGDITSHIIGYVGAVSSKELRNNPLANHPDFKTGKIGIEKSYDSHLRGHAGVRRTEVNAFGLVVRELNREESIPGDNIRLTIDAELQKFVFGQLDPRGAAAVVLDIMTGDILALCSTPGFDPNPFVEGVTTDYWQQLIENTNNPLVNKSVAKPYPPGSTFKMVVALAALKEGISPSHVLNCTGTYSFGDRDFHCWRKEGHGNVDLVEALAESCNTYFYQVAQRVGINKISAMARQLGLGDIFDIHIAEKSGIIPDKKWKQKNFGRDWLIGDTLNSSIGQGYLLVTPLQIAVMGARLASGHHVMPRLVLRNDMKNQEQVPAFEPLSISQSHLEIVRKGMERVVNHYRGTAYYRRIQEKEYAMAGKTGTSQVVSISHDEEVVKEVAREEQNHALFVGYAPYFAPRYAVTVVTEHGGSGSVAAAPIARDILLKVQQMKV